MRKIAYLALGLAVALLALSTSTAPVGYSLAYWAHGKHHKPAPDVGTN